MLPLVSSTSPRLTGTRSLLKCVISCSSFSSYTMKSFWRQAGDEAPVAVDDRRRDVDEIDAAAEPEFFLILPRDAGAAGDDDNGKRCRETDRRPQHVFS